MKDLGVRSSPLRKLTLRSDPKGEPCRGDDTSQRAQDLAGCYAARMPFPVELQDNLAVQLMPAGSDPARAALEDMAVEAYRARRLSEQQLATVPGMDRYELAGFLKKREVWLDYTADDLRREVEVGERLWRRCQEELTASGQ